MTPEPAETIRRTLEAVIYQVPGWTGPEPWFKPDVDAALEALAVLERRLNCDCVPAIVSSKSCPKCGRKSTIPQEQLLRWGGRLTELEGRLAEAALRDDRLLNVLRETERRLAEATAEIDRLHDKLAEALKMERVEYDEALRAEPATNTPSFNATLTPTTEPTPSFDGTLAPGFGEEPAKDAADYTWSEAKFTPIDLPDPLD